MPGFNVIATLSNGSATPVSPIAVLPAPNTGSAAREGDARKEGTRRITAQLYLKSTCDACVAPQDRSRYGRGSRPPEGRSSPYGESRCGIQQTQSVPSAPQRPPAVAR